MALAKIDDVKVLSDGRKFAARRGISGFSFASNKREFYCSYCAGQSDSALCEQLQQCYPEQGSGAPNIIWEQIKA